MSKHRPPPKPPLQWLLAKHALLTGLGKDFGITEQGWKAFQHAITEKNVNLSEKEIFFAGAGYTFAAIMAVMDDGEDPTEQDLLVMTRLHEELAVFDEGLRRKFRVASATGKP